MQEIPETRVRSLGQEDPLEEEWQPTPVSLPGKSPWTQEPGRLQSTGLKKLDMTEHTHPHATTRPLDIGLPAITDIIGERMVVCHDDRSDRNSKTRQRSHLLLLRLTKFQRILSWMAAMNAKCMEKNLAKAGKMTYAPPFDSAILLPGIYPRDMLQKY